MFGAFYDSAWQHPGIAWLGVAALVARMLRSQVRGGLAWYLGAFGVLAFVDALCTGALSPVPPGVMSSVGIVFVILGDWRLFVLVERVVGRGWLWRSIPLAFVVPVLQAIAIRTWPAVFEETRRIYLVYEALFVVLGLVLRLWVLPRRLTHVGEAERAWALGAVTWFVVQYALWVLSDVLILSGQDWALGLRVLPNAMYYAGFLLWVASTAPRSSSAS